MDEQNIPVVSDDRSTGRIIMGALLVAAGAALLIERLGVMPPMWRTSSWPVLLIGYGLARLLQPRARGREGLFFVFAGAWWLAGISGWISLERTWPLLIVAFGVSIMLQSVTADNTLSVGALRLGGRRHRGAPVLLLAILLGAAVSSGIGRRTYSENASGSGDLRVYSIVGGTNSRMRATTLTGGEVVSIMGGSAIDLRDATIPRGETVTLDVFTLMGGGTIRVPGEWIVDIQAVSIIGGSKDQRTAGDRRQDGTAEPGAAAEPGATAATSPAATSQGPAPRLIVRGTIVLGGLTIKS